LKKVLGFFNLKRNMMFRSLLFITFLFLSGPHKLWPQITSSARHLGMGEAGVGMGGQLNDLLGNPASLGFVSRPTILLGHRYFFNQPDINLQTLQLAFPIKKHGVAIALSHFGIEGAFRDLMMGICYAKGFGPDLSIGIGLRRQHLFIPAYVDEENYFLDFGAQYRMTEKMILGILVQQLNLSGNSYNIQDYLQFNLGAGLYYLFDKQLGFAFDMAYNQVSGILFKSGIEYNIVPDHFSLRLGLISKDLIPTSGFGISWNQFSLDLGSSFHPRLGMSPQIDLSYAF